MAVSERLSKNHSWSVWVGAEDDMRSLLRTVQKSYDPLLGTHVHDATLYYRQALATSEARLGQLNETVQADITKMSDAERNLHKGQMSVSVEYLARSENDVAKAKATLQDKEEEAQGASRIDLALKTDNGDNLDSCGTADELVDYLQGKRFNSASFSAPHGSILGHTIRLEFNRGEGLSLYVSSTDPSWARATYSELTEQIVRGVPWWRFVRALSFLYPLYFLTALAIWVFIVPLLHRVGLNGTSISTLITISVPLGAIGAAWLTRRLVPAFEILSHGRRARGTALFVVLGSAIGAIFLSLFTSLLENWLFPHA